MTLQRKRLAIGTAQFGLDYGITNTSGQVSLDEIVAILSSASDAGVDTLDTAALYGSSEGLLGEALALAGLSFSIITKTGKRLDARTDAEAHDFLLADLDTSMKRLGQQALDTLIVHDADELLGPNGDARWKAMEAARSQGLVSRIGASIYDSSQLDALLSRYNLDIVQVPLNAIDRRLLDSGAAQRLGSANIAVHARSAFLQGLLLAEKKSLPPAFSTLGPIIDGLETLAMAHDVPRLAILLAPLIRLEMVERIVVGMTTESELAEILAGLDAASNLDANAALDLPYVEDWLLDARLWPA